MHSFSINPTRNWVNSLRDWKSVETTKDYVPKILSWHNHSKISIEEFDSIPRRMIEHMVLAYGFLLPLLWPFTKTENQWLTHQTETNFFDSRGILAWWYIRTIFIYNLPRLCNLNVYRPISKKLTTKIKQEKNPSHILLASSQFIFMPTSIQYLRSLGE